MNSSNGTYVNGMKVVERDLQDGDKITIGSNQFLYRKDVAVNTYYTDIKAASASVETIDFISEDFAYDSEIEYNISREEAENFVPDVAQNDYQTLQNANKNLIVLYKINHLLRSSSNIDQIYPQLLEIILEVVTANRSFILLLDEYSQKLIPKAIRKTPPQMVLPDEEVPLSKTIIKHVMEQCEAVVTSNAMKDERFEGGQSIADLQICSAMCVPISGKTTTFGLIHVDTFGYSAYDQNDLLLLTVIGNEIGVAIENSRLVEADLRKERLAAVGETVAGLAHHVKNILNGIKGGTSLIKLGIETNEIEHTKVGWQILDRSLDKISDTVLNMLNYSKPRTPDYQEANINVLLLEVIDLFTLSEQEYAVNITYNLASDIPKMRFDPDQIHRSILNIFANSLDALEHTDGNGEIHLKTNYDKKKGIITISIHDTGPGIDPKIAASIFDIFTSTKGSRGTGLGLAVTGKIIKEHGGKISANSQAGKGTEFIIELPVQPLSTASTEKVKV